MSATNFLQDLYSAFSPFVIFVIVFCCSAPWLAMVNIRTVGICNASVGERKYAKSFPCSTTFCWHCQNRKLMNE